MRRFSIGTIAAVIAMTVVGTAAFAQGTVVTFDDGDEGWGGLHWNEIRDDGGVQGNVLNTTSIDYANNNAVLVGWYDTWTDSHPAFIGDYTQKGEVRICVDININIFDYLGWTGWIAVEQYREVAINLRDLDMQWQDPNYPNYPPHPWAEAQFFVSYMHSRDDGWATYCADVTDVHSMDLPDGWTGYGGPEDPNTYMPTLPPGYGWTDLLQGVDEVRINAVLHGWFYSYANIYDIDFDNISIGPIPQYCGDYEATVFVHNGMVYGGGLDGQQYNGVLKGTSGDDVIVGTDGDDTILGFDGNDMICGKGGNDNLMGHHDNDFIDGGEGDDNVHGQSGDDFLAGGAGTDHLNGGPGSDTCIEGENVNNCGDVMATPSRVVRGGGHEVPGLETGSGTVVTADELPQLAPVVEQQTVRRTTTRRSDRTPKGR